MQIKTHTLILFATLLIGFGVLMRLVPHAPNMTPIVAIGLVAGAYLGQRYAYIVPIIALLLSDLCIGFYDWRLMTSVYISFGLIGLIGWAARKYRSVQLYALFAVAGSTFFFLTTNAAVWVFSPWYEKSLSGLMLSYELGLPFWRNMIIGDVFYTVLLVGIAESIVLAYRSLQARCITA